MRKSNQDAKEATAKKKCPPQCAGIFDARSKCQEGPKKSTGKVYDFRARMQIMGFPRPAGPDPVAG
jgi:hypothetical protein